MKGVVYLSARFLEPYILLKRVEKSFCASGIDRSLPCLIILMQLKDIVSRLSKRLQSTKRMLCRFILSAHASSRPVAQQSFLYETHALRSRYRGAYESHVVAMPKILKFIRIFPEKGMPKHLVPAKNRHQIIITIHQFPGLVYPTLIKVPIFCAF